MIRRNLLLVLAILLAAAAAASAQSGLVLGTADSPPFSERDRTGFYDLLLREVAANLNLELEIRHLPSERSLREARSGRIDGEFGRIPRIGELYPNLLMVPEPLTDWQFSAFVLEGTPPPASFADLASYHVGYINGWKIYEDNVTATRSTTLVSSEEQLFSILRAKRVDVVLYNRLRGLDWIRRNPGTDIRLVETPLATRTMHVFLHESRADLVPLIGEQIGVLKRSGRYAELQQEAFGFIP